MTRLEQFRRTPAGKAIMSGAIFVSIFASPAYASIGNPDLASPPSIEQMIPPEKPSASAISTDKLTEMLKASIEDLEAYTLDLQSQKTLSERHLQVLKAMDGLVDDVNDLFKVDIDELSPVQKVTLARRIVENNLKLAKGRLSLDEVSVEAVEISLSPENEQVSPSAYSQLASNRQNLLDAIEETRVDIDYVVDEIAKSQNENAYYREALQEVTDLFDKILVASKPTDTSLQADFSALKTWQKEFRDEMATTEEALSVGAK
jgi:septal ring factor EnvC (AmiA/AmiB activator)